jgi:Protein of unknown function (DUF2997)
MPVPCHPAEDRPADRAQNRANAYNQPSHFSFPATELQGARPDSPVTQRAGPYHRQRPGKGHQHRRSEPAHETAGKDLLTKELEAALGGQVESREMTPEAYEAVRDGVSDHLWQRGG